MISRRCEGISAHLKDTVNSPAAASTEAARSTFGTNVGGAVCDLCLRSLLDRFRPGERQPLVCRNGAPATKRRSVFSNTAMCRARCARQLQASPSRFGGCSRSPSSRRAPRRSHPPCLRHRTQIPTGCEDRATPACRSSEIAGRSSLDPWSRCTTIPFRFGHGTRFPRSRPDKSNNSARWKRISQKPVRLRLLEAAIQRLNP
jgi:hypothetical protein